MKTIIFARVSTAEQKKEGHSIPAQLVRMREYRDSKGLASGIEYEIDESSTKEERKKFEEVIEYIKKSKDKVALLIETIDRLQRSFKESVVLDELRKKDKVEIHFIRENLVISVNSNSSDLIRWDMGVMFARSYVLQLSDNVKRSIEQNLREGKFPGKAPYGYKNIRTADDKSDIVVEEYQAQIVALVYKLYASKAYSFKTVRKKLKEDHGIEWSQGFLDKVLKNPFYHGTMLFKSKLYPHRYPPIITKQLFDEVQAVKASHNKKPFKYAGLPRLYRGLIRCGHCGLAVTPEEQKGTIYYHCTQYNGKHGASYVPEHEITAQIADVFKRIQVPQEVLEQIIDGLKNVHEGKVQFREHQYKALTNERNKYSNRIEKLYMDKLDGRITESEYDQYYQSFRSHLSELDTQLTMLQEAEDTYYLSTKYLLELAQKAHELFEVAEINERRQLIKLVLSNLKLDGKKLRYDAAKPFSTILEYADCQRWLPG